MYRKYTELENLRARTRNKKIKPPEEEEATEKNSFFYI